MSLRDTMNALPSIAQSGMTAAWTRMGVAAHNIANLQTSGYTAQAVHQEQDAGGSVSVSVIRPSNESPDLAEQLVELMASAYSFKANLRVIQAHDHVLGSLLDTVA